MPKRDNSTAYWRRLVASITRRVQHACINHRATLSRATISVPATVCRGRELFCRRKPYQSEIRKDNPPVILAPKNRISLASRRWSPLIQMEYDILFSATQSGENDSLCRGWETSVDYTRVRFGKNYMGIVQLFFFFWFAKGYVGILFRYIVEYRDKLKFWISV